MYFLKFILVAILTIQCNYIDDYDDELSVCHDRAKRLYEDCLYSNEIRKFYLHDTTVTSSETEYEIFLLCSAQYLDRFQCKDQKRYRYTRKRDKRDYISKDKI